MFSKGQQTFALIFLICFVILMIWAYRSDAKVIKNYYKNTWVVLVTVLAILAGIIILIKVLH